jgi:hypothetical protein
MAFRFPIRAYTRAQLEMLSKPAGANQPEALPHVLFDTHQYLTGATLRLVFFQTVVADKTLSNMEAAGQLPDPQYFQIYNVGVDIMLDVSEDKLGSGSLLSAADDVQLLTIFSHPTLTLTVAGKRLISGVPLSHFHCSGGVKGFTDGTWTAAAVSVNYLAWGLNSHPDGGWHTDGTLFIPPKQAFDVVIEWAGVVATCASPLIRVWMAGVWSRRVL